MKFMKRRMTKFTNYVSGIYRRSFKISCYVADLNLYSITNHTPPLTSLFYFRPLPLRLRFGSTHSADDDRFRLRRPGRPPPSLLRTLIFFFIIPPQQRPDSLFLLSAIPPQQRRWWRLLPFFLGRRRSRRAPSRHFHETED